MIGDGLAVGVGGFVASGVVDVWFGLPRLAWLLLALSFCENIAPLGSHGNRKLIPFFDVAYFNSKSPVGYNKCHD